MIDHILLWVGHMVDLIELPLQLPSLLVYVGHSRARKNDKLYPWSKLEFIKDKYANDKNKSMFFIFNLSSSYLDDQLGNQLID